MVVLFDLQGYTNCRLNVDFGNGDTLTDIIVTGSTYIFDPKVHGRDTINGIYSFTCDDNCSFTKVISDDCYTSGSTIGGDCDCDEILTRILNLENRLTIIENNPGMGNVSGRVQFTKFQRGVDVNSLTTIPASRDLDFEIEDLGWVDNPDDTTGSGALFAVTTTLDLSNPTVVDGWSNPLKYEGSEGRRYRELFIFRRFEIAPTTEPTGGAFNFLTDEFTPPTGWSDKPSTAAGTGSLYISSGYATGESDEIDTNIVWSVPVKFNGDDGTSLDIIYKRSETQPPTPPNSPIGSIPDQWFSAAYGDQTQGRLWASVGYLYPNATQWVWDEPYAAEGLDGRDGTDIEFIFKVTSQFVKPTDVLTPTDWLTNNQYQSVDTEYIPTGWFDDPQEVTQSNPYQWHSIRRRVDGVWLPFSDPQLWNQYATVGSEGKRFKELFIYRYEMADNPPATPSGGAYNFDNDVFELPDNPVQWYDTAKEARDNNTLNPGDEGTLYISTGTASGFASGPSGNTRDAFITWSEPTEFTGVPGSIVNIIYQRSETEPSRPANTPKNDPATAPDESIPVGWVDRVGQLISGPGRIWGSYGILNPGESEWVWDDPYVLEGLDGKDGTDIEFIFIRTRSIDDVPVIDTVLRPLDYLQSGSTYQTSQEFITQIENVDITFGTAPNEYTSRWTDDPTNVDSLYTHQWFTRRERRNTIWESWRPISLWNNYSNDGIDGLQYKELFIYRKFASPTNAITPSGGSYNFDTTANNFGITPPPDWYDNPADADENGPSQGEVYVSTGYASTEVSNIDSDIQWSKPYRFVGGEGALLNLVYIRTEDPDGPETPAPTMPDVSGSPLNESIPNGWYETATGATGTGVLWYSLGQFHPQTTNGMWEWSKPIKAEPLDGKGIEFIFLLTPSGVTSVTNPTPFDYDTNPLYQAIDSEYITELSGQTMPIGWGQWTDNPSSLTEQLPLSWVSTRRFDGDKWGPFSNPQINARWARDGRDGTEFEKIFILTPNLTDKPLNPTPTGDTDNDPIYQQVDYLPYPNNSNQTPEGFTWTDNPFDTSEEFKFQWYSERKRVNGIWQPFNEPSLWSRWGRDGDTYEFIYMLTRDQNNKPTVTEITPPDSQDPNSNYQTNVEYISFITGETYTFTVSGTSETYTTRWTDEAQDVQSPSFRAQWYTLRTKKDGVWSDWEQPKLWTLYGEDGERIEYIYVLTQERDDVPSNPTPTNWEDLGSDYQTLQEYVSVIPQEQLTGFTSGNTYNITWSDDPGSVNQQFKVQWYSHRRRVGGRWRPFTDPIVWSEIGAQGIEGKGYKELFIYKRFQSNTLRETPSGGSFNFSNEVLDTTNLTTGWTQDLASLSGETGLVYVSFGYAKGNSNQIDDLIEWSQPALFTGPPGTLVNLIYTRAQNKPNKPLDTGEDIDSTEFVDESIPNGWFQIITDVGGTAEQGRIWQSFGFKEPDSNVWVWSEPVPAEPLDGEDGNGVEHIYRLGTDINTPPIIPDVYYDNLPDGITGATYQTEDFVPTGITVNDPAEPNEFWSDKLQQVSFEYPIQWVSKRRFGKLIDPNTGLPTIKRYWGKFETPKLYNRYNTDGRAYRELFIFRVFDPVADAAFIDNGIPVTPSGGTYSFVTDTFDDSTMTPSGWSQSNASLGGDVWFTTGFASGTNDSEDVDIQWNRPQLFTEGMGTLLNIVYRISENRPPTPGDILASGNTRPVPNEWFDDPINVTGNTNHSLWASVGYLYSGTNSWTFQTPYVAEYPEPKDGPGREFIFILTTDDTQVPFIEHPSDYNDEGSIGQSAEFIPSNLVDGRPWNDDILQVTAEFKILWMSSRTFDGNTWSLFGDPKIISRYAKDGKAFRELFIYKRATEIPITPNGGQYDFTDNTFVIPSGWYDNMRDAFTSETEGDIYVSTTFAEGDTEGTDSVDNSLVWSAPQIFNGRDGSLLNIVYKRSETIPNTPTPQPVDSSNRNNPQIPPTWYDSPFNVPTGQTGQLWESKGILNPSDDEWVYGDPISVEGRDGRDGKDIEFIFTVTQTNNTPQNPTPTGDILSNQNYQTDGFIPTGLTDTWFDDPQDVTSVTPYQWASKRVKLNGLWDSFSTPKLWNNFAFDGNEGRAYKELFAYRASVTPPQRPGSGATYNFSNDVFTPPANWFRTVSEARSNSLVGDMYAVTASASGFPDSIDENIVWSDPFEFVGKPGTILNVIFKRFNESTTAQDVIDEVSGVTIDIDPSQRSLLPMGDLPTGWFDDATLVPTIPNTRLWSVIAYLEPDATTWKFKSAVIAEGLDGIDGRDGDSIEQIFIRTKSLADVPTLTYNITDPLYQDEDEYFPFISGDTQTFSTVDGTYTTQWTDDPLTVNTEWRYQLVSIRRRNNGVWGPFSQPVIWSSFAIDGDKGDVGGDGNSYKELFLYSKFPEGQQPATVTGGSYTFGIDGPSGDTINLPNGWFTSISSILSTQCVDDQNTTCRTYMITGTAIGRRGETDSDIEWSNPARIDTQPGQVNIIYKDVVSGTPTTPTITTLQSPIPSGWSDTIPSGVTSGRTWASFGINPPESNNWIWNTPYVLEGKDGQSIEFIFTLTSGSTRPGAPLGLNVDEYIPSGWFDDAQDVDDINRYQWVSQRKRLIDGSWGDFTTPRLWNRFVESGVLMEFSNDIATFGVNQLSDVVPNTSNTPLQTEIFIFDGLNDVTGDWNVTIQSETGISGQIDIIGGRPIYRVTSMDPVAEGFARISAENNGVNVVKDFKVTKLLNGTPGASYKIFANESIIKLDDLGVPQITDLTITPQIVESLSDGAGGYNTSVNPFSPGIVKVFLNNTSNQLGSNYSGSNSYTISLPTSSFSKLILNLYLSDGTTLVDSETINTVSDGQDGIGSFSLLLSNDGDTFPVTESEVQQGFTTDSRLNTITTMASIYQGDQIITNPTASGWTFDIVSPIGVSGATILSAGVEGAFVGGINRLSTVGNGGSFTVRATSIGGSSFRKTFKLRPIQDVPDFFRIRLRDNLIPSDNTGIPKISEISFTAGLLSGENIVYTPGMIVEYTIDSGLTYNDITINGNVDYTAPTLGMGEWIDIRLSFNDGGTITVVDEQRVRKVLDGDKGDDTVLYYIRPVNGTAIRNSSGTVELEVVQVVGNNEIVLTSGDVSMVDASTNNPVSSLPDTTGDDYNITIGPNAITNGRLDVALVSGGTTLDSITIADITDGVPAGYIQSDGLVFKNIKGDSNINPSNTSLTATFENIGSTNFVETVDITPLLTLDGNPQMSYVITTIHPDIDLTVVDNNGITVNENQIVQTDSLTFTFSVGGRFSTSETVFFVSDGEQGIAGPQGIPGVSPKTVRLVADKQILIVDSSETVIKPDTITFTTETQNTTGIVNWSISPANSGFNTAGDTATLSHTDWDIATPQYTITTTVDGISDSVTVKLLKEGSSTITGILSNEAVTLVVNEQTNTINDLTGTGTRLSVYQGEEKLDYLGTGNITASDANGTWRIQTINYPSTRVTLNTPTISGQDMLAGDIVSVTPSPIPTIGFTIEYVIQIKSLSSGSISTFTKEQTFTMSIQPPQTYTWIGYANDANGTGLSGSASGKSHIGFAYNRLQQTPNFSNINSGWILPFTKIEGEDGVPGAPGADGQTLYTWILYAPNGSPFTSQVTQQPQINTTHIGIAVNQTSSTERTDQTALNTLYTWTNFKGDDGLPTAEAQEISADVEGNPPGSPSLLFGGTTTLDYLNFISARDGTILEGMDTWVVGDVIVDTSNKTVAPNSDLLYAGTQYMWNGKDWTISTMRTTSSGIIVDTLFTNRLATNQAFIRELLTQKIVVSGPGGTGLNSNLDTGIEYIGSGGVFDLGLTSTSNRPFMTMTEGTNSISNISSNHIQVSGRGNTYHSSNLQWGNDRSTVWVGKVVNGAVLNSFNMDTLDDGVRLQGKHNDVEFLLINKDVFTYSGTITADDFALPSDIKLKENITNIENPLEKVLGLNGVMFDWKKDGKHDTGLIAQEVEQVMPEVVYTDDNGDKTVSYPKLVGLLVEAIKELSDKIQK